LLSIAKLAQRTPRGRKQSPVILPVIDDRPHYPKRLRVQLERLARLEEKNTGLVAAEATIRDLAEQSVVGIRIDKADPFVYVHPGIAGIFAARRGDDFRALYNLFVPENHALAC
jgi:hypothetical protein